MTFNGINNAVGEGHVPTVSVLMSTYMGESAANLAAAIESIYAQTVPPDQIVLVIDGPVCDEQEAVIARYGADRRAGRIDIVRLPGGRGLAQAMNAGLEQCICDYVARMDSDDISMPDRLELQLAYVERDPSLEVVGSWSEEFFEDGTKSQLKITPVRHDAIVSALRWRNVLVHPALLIRTAALRQVGGYMAEFGKLEDYDLFVRLAQAGVRFHNIPKVLVRVRSSLEQRARRGGLDYCVREVRFRLACFRRGFLNTRQFLLSTSMYVLFRLVSATSRRHAYAMVRR
jgi:glycosyltransferase involved in cell wall biosynthesis